MQVACARGATVIGTTSTKNKLDVARECGAEQIILHTEQDILKEVMRITGRLAIPFSGGQKSPFLLAYILQLQLISAQWLKGCKLDCTKSDVSCLYEYLRDFLAPLFLYIYTRDMGRLLV